MGGHDQVEVFDKNKVLILRSKISKNQTFQVCMDAVGSWHCLSTVKDDETWKWHLGFDHLNFKDLRQLSEKGLVSGIPEISISENVCESCIVGKQSRKPFQARLEMRSKGFLDVVYSDICGHMEVSILA